MALGFAIGFVIGALAVAALFGVVVPQWLKGKKVHAEGVKRGALALALVALMVGVMAVGNVHTLYAQETPVPLDIPINDIMVSTNSWLTTFAPIAAIGIGISIALAVLGYLGKMIKSAFT
jgi:hypothetical protein